VSEPSQGRLHSETTRTDKSPSHVLIIEYFTFLPSTTLHSSLLSHLKSPVALQNKPKITIMGLLTPPQSYRKRGFMGPRKKLYYEDLYGRRNYNEEFDRYADNCDNETESDKETDQVLTSDVPTAGFSKPYTGKQKRGSTQKRSGAVTGLGCKQKAHSHCREWNIAC